MYGDVATLEALQSVTLQGISQEDTITGVSHIQKSRDVVGRTAAQLAEQRSDVTPEWREAFRRLVRAIGTANNSEAGESQDSVRNPTPDSLTNLENMECFEDAVEYQAHELFCPTANLGRARRRTF